MDFRNSTELALEQLVELGEQVFLVDGSEKLIDDLAHCTQLTLTGT